MKIASNNDVQVVVSTKINRIVLPQRPLMCNYWFIHTTYTRFRSLLSFIVHTPFQVLKLIFRRKLSILLAVLGAETLRFYQVTTQGGAERKWVPFVLCLNAALALFPRFCTCTWPKVLLDKIRQQIFSIQKFKMSQFSAITLNFSKLVGSAETHRTIHGYHFLVFWSQFLIQV